MNTAKKQRGTKIEKTLDHFKKLGRYQRNISCQDGHDKGQKR